MATAFLGSMAIATWAQTSRPVAALPKVTGTSSAQIRFVPEILNVIAGGTNDQQGADNSEGIAATAARLNTPWGVAIDSRGNVYITDVGTSLVRRVSATDGTIATVVGVNSGNNLGERPRGEAKSGFHANDTIIGVGYTLNRPTAIAIGPGDTVYFTDSGDDVIYKLDSAGNLSIVAGTIGSEGYSADGTIATAAMLNQPSGLTVDTSGNLYFSDTNNNIVRRIDATTGKLSTIAGNYGLGGGFSGSGFAAINAQLQTPQGLALDAAGNLLIADTGNYVVSRIDFTTGILTVVAGNNNYGSSGDGAAATAATLSNPIAITTDSAGDIYIADGSNNIVRRVAVDGTINSVAGMRSGFSISQGYGGAATGAQLGRLSGIAIDAAGSVITEGSDYGFVYKVGPAVLLDFRTEELHNVNTLPLTIENNGTAALTFTGNVFTVSGSGFSSGSADAKGCTPSTSLAPGASCRIAVNFAPQQTGDYSETLTITDSLGSQTVSLKGTGVRPTPNVALAIAPTNTTAGNAITFSATVGGNAGSVPTGTVTFVDGVTGNTLTSAALDTTGNGSATTTLPPGIYTVTANYPGDTTYNSNVSDEQDLTVSAKPATVALTASATVASAGDTVSLNATVTASAGTPTGNVQFRVDGASVATATISGGNASATISVPAPGHHSLQAVYAGDSQYGTAFSNLLPLTTHGAILQISPGSAMTIAGVPQDDLHFGFGGDGGPATTAYMHTPNGVAVDGAGNVFIADEQNNVIRKVTTDGTISTVAGIPYAGSIYSTRFGGDGGPAASAYLDNPAAVAIDAAGNLYIADFSNNVVRKVNASDGIINTIAGTASHAGYNGTGGAATATWLNGPAAIALDVAGNLYIADYGNNLLRKVDTAGQMTTIAGSYYASHNSNPVDGSPATSVDLYHPMGVAVDPTGIVYIGDTQHNLVRKIVNGNLYTVAGNTGYAPETDGVQATQSALSQPEQLTFDTGGNLYIAETGSDVIRKVDTAGNITTVIGYLGAFTTTFYYFDPAGAPANTFQLVSPSSVAVDTSGNIYATDNFNETVIRVGPTSTLLFGPDSGANDPQALTLYNSGDAILAFNATPYAIIGNYTLAAEGTNPCSFSAGLMPGASCTVAGRNGAIGGSSGTITFSSNTQGPTIVNLHTLTNAKTSATTLALSENTGNVGDNILLFGQVSVTGPPATGRISFYDGTTVLGSATIASGYAYIYVSTLTAGKHIITAKYAGGGVYGASTSDPQELDLTGTPTLTTLVADKTNAAYGTAVTFTTTVSTSGSVAVTSGSVSFSDGTSTLATRTVDASGTASFTSSSLLPGVHNITATYSANGGLAPSTSSVVAVTITGGGGGGTANALNYSVTVDGLPVVIHRGETRNINVTVTALNNFGGTVQLSCGTLPSYATCTFSQPSIIIGGPFPTGSSILTITTSPATGSGQSLPMVVTGSGLNGMPQLVAAKP